MRRRKSRKGIKLGKFYTIYYQSAPDYKALLLTRIRALSPELARDKFIEKFEMGKHVIVNKVEWSA